MKELDDVTLRRAIKGDRRAFKTLYDHYAPFLWKVLFSMGGRDMTTTRELVQDTFVKVHASLGQFRGNSTFSTWLYRIAYTTTVASLRRTRLSALSSTSADINTISGQDRTDTFDDKELAGRILSSLSAEDRFLLIAREVEDIAFDELALITGRNAGALRTQLHRLKEGIRKTFPQETFAAPGV
jgi:RNA polymerase sigma-70 factor (ECF subfamily)